MSSVRALARENGFSLIEVLIALLVLAIGLLGMASLMLTSMKSNQSAYQRSQANWLAYDIAERMRLNRNVAITGNSYVVTTATATPSDPGCKANGCSATNVAQLDVHEWMTQLALAGVRGTVARLNTNQYTITISWQEDSSRACAPVNGTPQCSFVLRVNL
ncbi:type IV pilus modification protein PilV [Metapseudomonas resinovorans]|uniref:type IV pilus modification protein PilV n=1 Tax=Metapseudomonas resinovorans TaxID=53412 RepID=UPI0009878DB5|nr:type IV pilus modification protein PilV [Pseudomonas resinovorans]GLZ84049.1 type IV pilus modification protein PilV [Pseudomonas resinovorans]